MDADKIIDASMIDDRFCELKLRCRNNILRYPSSTRWARNGNLRDFRDRRLLSRDDHDDRFEGVSENKDAED